MARPTIPNIKVPKANSPLSKQNENVKGGGCGQSWKHSYELVRPYGQTSNYKRWMDEFGSWDDLEKLPNPDFIARIEDAIEVAWDDLDKFENQGVIDADDYDKIRKYLNRANNYASTATKLYNFWAEEYAPPNLRWTDLPKSGRPPGRVIDSDDAHWALDNFLPFLGKCGSGYGDAPAMRGKAGDEQKTRFKDPTVETQLFWVKFNCPSESTIDMHIADRSRYKELMEAAALNARCAQESLYTTAFYRLNKAETDLPGRAPKKTLLTGMTVRHDLKKQEIEPLPPGTELPPDLPEPEAEEDKKPGTGAILALGAAAIVLLAARGRR